MLPAHPRPIAERGRLVDGQRVMPVSRGSAEAEAFGIGSAAADRVSASDRDRQRHSGDDDTEFMNVPRGLAGSRVEKGALLHPRVQRAVDPPALSLKLALERQGPRRTAPIAAPGSTAGLISASANPYADEAVTRIRENVVGAAGQ
jgi:hypothetical protein